MLRQPGDVGLAVSRRPEPTREAHGLLHLCAFAVPAAETIVGLIGSTWALLSSGCCHHAGYPLPLPFNPPMRTDRDSRCAWLIR